MSKEKQTAQTSTSTTTVIKPPLVVKPWVLWHEERMVELARAIYEYTKAGYFDSVKVGNWCDELSGMLRKAG